MSFRKRGGGYKWREAEIFKGIGSLLDDYLSIDDYFDYSSIDDYFDYLSIDDYLTQNLKIGQKI